jgi:hypothetical protein
MYKPSTYQVLTYFLYQVPTYVWDLFPSELATKVKPNINSVAVHPYLSNNGHPVDGALVGAGSQWLCIWRRAPDHHCVNIGWHFVQKVPHFLWRVVCRRLLTSLKWITAFHLLRRILLVFYARWGPGEGTVLGIHLGLWALGLCWALIPRTAPFLVLNLQIPLLRYQTSWFWKHMKTMVTWN